MKWHEMAEMSSKTAQKELGNSFKRPRTARLVTLSSRLFFAGWPIFSGLSGNSLMRAGPLL